MYNPEKVRAFSFYVPGVAMGKERPRFNRNGHAYTSVKTRTYMQAIRDAFDAAGGFSFGKAPVSVSILIERALPKSRPARVRAEAFTCKPDADNVAKVFLDALNGRAWDDDSQIIRLSVAKQDRTRICGDGVTVIINEVGRFTL